MTKIREPRRQTVLIEDAEIRFRNFSGLEGKFNREGDRNFTVLLSEETAEAMTRDGWNVKYLKAREEGDSDQAIVQVAVSFKNTPPQIYMVTGERRTQLDESTISLLDLARIERSDLIISPYDYTVNGKSGRKAYLQKLFVVIEEDELDRKYSNVPDSALNCVGDECEIPAPRDALFDS